jgi:hypothetical protein
MEDQQNNILEVSAYSCSPPNTKCYEFCYQRVAKFVGNMALTGGAIY